MKSLKNLLAVLLAVVIAVTAMFPVVNAEEKENRFGLKSRSQYQSLFLGDEKPTFTTDDFFKIVNTFNTVFRVLTGTIIFPERKFKVEFDETLTEICNYVCENAGLDIVKIFSNLPETKDFALLTTKLFRIDTAEMRRELYAKSDECWDNGDNVNSMLYLFLGTYFSVMDDCCIYGEEIGEDLIQVAIKITFRDGGEKILYPGITIDLATGECYNGETGMVNTGFNYNLNELLVYAPIHAWMRGFGFTVAYDIACYIMPMWNYITRRFKFDYQGREWMVQVWKGNYLITNGGEVGLYNRDAGSFGTYYNCATDDELLEMTMKVSHGDDVLVDLGPEMHWWINGFKMGKSMYNPRNLTLEFSLVMPDEEMLEAFCEAVDNHYLHDVTYTTDGLKVSCVW